MPAVDGIASAGHVVARSANVIGPEVVSKFVDGNIDSNCKRRGCRNCAVMTVVGAKTAQASDAQNSRHWLCGKSLPEIVRPKVVMHVAAGGS